MRLALTILTVISLNLIGYSQCTNLVLQADKSLVCAPDIVGYQLLNAPAGSTFQWNVGNGWVNGADTLYSFYGTEDTIDAVVIVTLPNGSVCQITEYAIVEIHEKPEPVFKSSDYLLCHGTGTVTLTDLTPGSASRNWVVDGTNYNQTGDSMQHTFVTTGWKTVSLVVTDSFGCQGSNRIRRYHTGTT